MRPIGKSEIPLVAWLLRLAGAQETAELLQVESMNDGGMGSMRIFPFSDSRIFGETVAEALFEDEDGTPVVASLNLDSQGQLYEVDIWRVDFGPLQRWPNAESLVEPSPTPRASTFGAT